MAMLWARKAVGIAALVSTLVLVASGEVLFPAQIAGLNASASAGDVVLDIRADASVLLLEGRPSFVYFNSSCSPAAGAVCQDWLAVALKDIYEQGPSGRVPGRSGADVLDVSNATWTSGRRTLGAPPVEVEVASIELPAKPCPAACPGGGAAPTGPPARVTLELILAGDADFNVTALPGNDRARTEVLAGNAKWSVRAWHWPFCSPDNKLAVEFSFLSANASAPPVAQNGTQLSQLIADQAAHLTGAADPQSVPVTGADASPSPAPEVQAAAQQLEADLRELVALDPSSPTATSNQTAEAAAGGGRRRLQRGGGRSSGSRGGSSRASNKGTTTTVSRPTPVCAFWPNGGTSRPRYPSGGAAVTGLPFSPAQRGLLNGRFVAGRPVYGLGRRPFLPFHYFLFFPLLGAGHHYYLGHQAQRVGVLDVATHVVVDNATLAVAELEVPPRDAATGAQAVTVLLPHFADNVLYDPVVAFGPSEEEVDAEIMSAIDSVMAYNETGNGAVGVAGSCWAALAGLLIGAVLVL